VWLRCDLGIDGSLARRMHAATNAPAQGDKEDVQKATGEKSTPKPETSQQERSVYTSADAAAAEKAAAEAANHKMTLEDLNNMSDDNAILLGNCQMVKYQMENGKAALDRWMDDFVDQVASASSASEVVSVQEAMIKDGYSCTFQEMNDVAATGTLSEE
jgi:hypothetical protein